MFTLLRYFFLTLGFIFFAILVATAYIWFANVWNVQAIFSAVTQEPTTVEMTEDGEGINESLTAEQQKAMDDFGISSDFFTDLDAEQQACLADVLGEERVEEIKQGAMPTPVEIARGSSCL